MKVLVDTCIWSLALRRKPNDLSIQESSKVAELRDLIGDSKAAIIGVIRQELLSGIKSPAQFESIRSQMRAFPDEVLATEDYESAAAFASRCTAKGIAAPVVDLLLCALSIRDSMPILTIDPDFKRYATVLPIQLY